MEQVYFILGVVIRTYVDSEGCKSNCFFLAWTNAFIAYVKILFKRIKTNSSVWHSYFFSASLWLPSTTGNQGYFFLRQSQWGQQRDAYLYPFPSQCIYIKPCHKTNSKGCEPSHSMSAGIHENDLLCSGVFSENVIFSLMCVIPLKSEWTLWLELTVLYMRN